MKSGVKTTEFWISFLALIYNAVLGLNVIPHGEQITTAINGIAALLVALGYTWARVFIKSKG